MLANIFNFIFGLVLAALVILVVLHLVTRRFREIRRMAKNTLTLKEYVNRYPQAKTTHGIKCIVCGSQSIRNWGVADAGDRRRVFICNHCDTRLYRSDNW